MKSLAGTATSAPSLLAAPCIMFLRARSVFLNRPYMPEITTPAFFLAGSVAAYWPTAALVSRASQAPSASSSICLPWVPDRSWVRVYLPSRTVFGMVSLYSAFGKLLSTSEPSMATATIPTTTTASAPPTMPRINPTRRFLGGGPMGAPPHPG